MTEPTMPELAPCPFCGEPAELTRDSDHHGEWFNLGCSQHWHRVDPDKACPAGLLWYTAEPEGEAKAIDAWNRRTLPADPPAAWIEAMAEDIGNTMTDGATLTVRQIARSAYAALARQMGGGDAE